MSNAAVALIWLALLAPVRVIGQTKSIPRTPDGQPDFQGVWATATLTPLERPPEFAGKEFLTQQEAAEYERRTLQLVNTDRASASGAFPNERRTLARWRPTPRSAVSWLHTAGGRMTARV
jgi:hypothetical protein